MLEDKENAFEGNPNLMIFSPPKALKDRAEVINNNVHKEVPSILLEKFQAPMSIEFKDVEVGSFHSMLFTMINPNTDKAITATVDKVPQKMGFEVLLDSKGSSHVEIAANSKMQGIITWSPNTNMGVKAKAVIMVNDRIPVHINIIGKAGTGKVRDKRLNSSFWCVLLYCSW